MKILIDIPEECLKNISNAFEFGEDITKRTIDIILDSITKSTPIPDNATNGEVIMAMFPNVNVYEHNGGATYSVNNEYNFNATWWNAPYQKGDKE